MSLLIQALKKAEHNKNGGGNHTSTPDDALSAATLTLESLRDETPLGNTSFSDAYNTPGSDARSSSAANLFAAKQHKQISPFAIAVGIGALILTGWGGYVYYQLITPQPFIPASNPKQDVTARIDARVAQESHDSSPKNLAPTPQPEPATNDLDKAPRSVAEIFPSAPKTDQHETPQHNEAKIQFKRESAPSAVSPSLANAYQALKENRLDSAQMQYQRLLSTEPNNIDALLGLAAISAQQGKTDQSAKYLLRVLELDPKNAAAQAGLISFMGKADPITSESRLKQLIQNQPAAFLFFSLGNLYAGQSQWAAAEHAYFQAYQMELGNPDFAYNLAVSLEHLQQTRQALSYYQQALRLMQKNGNANFDKTLLLARINQLSTLEQTGDAK